MKKALLPLLYIGLCLFCFAFLSGCLKDNISRTYTIYKPVFKSLTEVRADMKSSPAQPMEQTGKLNIYKHYIFLNEVNKGIHIIDNSQPSQPKNIAFIHIPGNGDLAIKGDYLYADSYSDLVVFDIRNPQNVTAKKFINRIFPDRGGYYTNNSNNPDSAQVITGYISKDTTVDADTYNSWNNCSRCLFYDASSAAFSTAKSNIVGVGGSMSRFTIISDYLYSVSTSELYSFNISNGAEPVLSSRSNMGNWNIETIYPFKNKLFIGSSNGMFIYDLSSPGSPSQLSQFSHVRSCDPVIADGDYAYVTLRSGTQCQGFTNQLEVLNIANLTQPSLLKIYPMTNPHGLSKDSDLLFICDGKDGLKVYDAKDANNMQLQKTISGMETYDVIAQNDLAIIVAKDGLYQFDYSDKNNIKQLSKISLTQQ